MRVNQMNNKKKFYIAILTILSVIALCNKTTFAHGGGVATDFFSGGSWTFNCNTNSTCPRWIKVPISVFKEIYRNSDYNYHSSKLKADNDGYKICTDSTKNKDGYVIFTGLTEFSSGGNGYSYKNNTLALINPSYNPGKYSPKNNLKNLPDSSYHLYDAEQTTTKNMSNLYTNIDSNLTYYDIYKEVLAASGLSENYDDQTSSTNPYQLAFFCYGMTTPAETAIMVNYSVTEKATINGTDYTDKTYTISGDTDGKATVTINFSREVKSNPEGYSNWHDESMLIAEDGTTKQTDNGGIGIQTLTNKSITVTLDQVNRKKICATSTIAPQTETWSGGSQISNSGQDDDTACVTIKMNWTSETPVEQSSEKQQDITYTASCSKYPASTEIKLPAGTQDQTIEYIESTGQWKSGSLPTDMTGVSLPDASDFGHYYSQTTSLQPGQDKTAKYDGFREKIYTVKYNKIDHYTKYTDHNVDGTETTRQDYKNTTYQYLGTDVRDGNKITCNDTHIYRMTEIDTSTEINLKSGWNVNSTSYNLGLEGITHTVDDANPIETKIYSSSENGEAVNLDYTYKLNYKWLTDTYSTRLTDYNTINWWAYSRINKLEDYSLNAASHWGMQSENDPDWKITNIKGAPSNNNESSEITLGSIQEYCRSAKAPATYEAGYQTNPTQKGASLNTATICAKIYRPWNYDLSFTSIESTSNGGKLYLNNEETSVTLKLQNGSHDGQEGNPSYSPETTISLYQITISDSELTSANISDYIEDLKLKIKNGVISGTSVVNPQKIIFDPKSNNNKVEFKDVSFKQAGIGDHICLYATANHTDSYNDTINRGTTEPIYYGTPKENNLYSNLTCFTVAGFPTFQIRGGSILTSGSIKAKVVESNGEYFGSWIDYGIIANGEIKELSSGKAFIGSEYKYPNNHPLTIANSEAYTSGSNDPKGKSNINPNATKNHLLAIYGSNTNATPVTSKTIDISNSDNYTNYTSNQFTTISTNSSSKYRYTKINNDAEITQSSQLEKGVTHVIYSSENITIKSNITYTSENLNLITDIPQYIIISEKNIYIDQDVTEIHAWLIAKEEINTCTGYTGWQNPKGTNNILHKQDGSDGYDSATYNKDVCNSALTIYGPIFAKSIWLERTSTNGVSGISETVNLTAENYYWALAKAKESNKISTAYIRSLAPRY